MCAVKCQAPSEAIPTAEQEQQLMLSVSGHEQTQEAASKFFSAVLPPPGDEKLHNASLMHSDLHNCLCAFFFFIIIKGQAFTI